MKIHHFNCSISVSGSKKESAFAAVNSTLEDSKMTTSSWPVTWFSVCLQDSSVPSQAD